jgi:hypothetical protein
MLTSMRTMMKMLRRQTGRLMSMNCFLEKHHNNRQHGEVIQPGGQMDGIS